MKIKKIIYLPKKCTLLYQIIEDFNYVWKMEDSQTLIMKHFNTGRLPNQKQDLTRDLVGRFDFLKWIFKERFDLKHYPKQEKEMN